jgi:hypothetical protein
VKQKNSRPLAGRILHPEDARGMSREAWQEMVRLGAIPVMAGGADAPAQIAQPDPLGIGLDAAGRLVIDDYVNPPTRIPAIIRDLVRGNQGYWIEDVFNTPGMTVEGGAILYTETFPEDHFLDPGQTIAPRSPGSEAPRIGHSVRRPKLARPESWSGSIEVTDEARRWNRLIEVQDSFRKAANTFADRLQARGEEVLGDFVTAASRFVVGGAGTFSDWNAAQPEFNYTSTAPRPSAEFARVQRLYVQDKVGQQPDLLIVSPGDAEQLDRIYGGGLDALLNRYGLTMRVSVRRPDGRRLYVRRQQAGTMAFDKPLGAPEYTREGQRFTDVYTLETVPVFVAHGADAIMEVRNS